MWLIMPFSNLKQFTFVCFIPQMFLPTPVGGLRIQALSIITFRGKCHCTDVSSLCLTFRFTKNAGSVVDAVTWQQ